MNRLLFILFLIGSINPLFAKEDNSLKEKLWRAVKDYIKDTDSYKIFNYGKKEIKKIKKKINKKLSKLSK
jgi:hypothetical protein